MYKTKAKSKIKNTMWKKFTIRGKKLAQKLLSVGVSVSLMMAMVPLGSQNFVAEAAPPEIPETMFITTADLLKLCANTNNGQGLLASATAADNKEININFGTRPGDVKYYDDASWSNSVTVEAGPMTWRVAGAENNGLVLYSKEPMISANALASASNSLFQENINDQTFIPESDAGYGDRTPKTVYANHYGASTLRKQLQSLVGDYFKDGEQVILEDSTVTTNDTKNSVDYTIKDPLYAARLKDQYSSGNNTSITVGETDDFKIDKVYWAGNSWLRSPHPDTSNDALYTWTGTYVDDYHVNDHDLAGAAACRINLENVLFAAAASGSSTAATFSNIDPNTPMSLRLDGRSQGKAEIGAVEGTIAVKNANGWNVVVQGVTDSGQSWSYSAPVDTNKITSFTADNVVSACGSTISGFSLDDFDNCKVWLEKSGDNDGTLSYAISASTTLPTPDEETPDTETPETPSPDDAISILSTIVQIGDVSQKIMVRDINKILPAGTQLIVKVVANHEELDTPTYDVEKQFHYEITLVDAEGNSLPMPLSQNVELLFEVVTGLDKEDLEVVLAQIGPDVQFEEELITIEGVTYVGVLTNHFSPYSLIDKLTDEEKAELDKLMENLSDEQKQQLEQQAESALEQIKTGDEVTYFTISGLGLIMTLALGLMIKSKLNKRKFE